MQSIIKAFVITVLLLSWASLVMAKAEDIHSGSASEKKGRDIISKVIEQDDGFGDFYSNVEMTITDAKGNQRMRKMQVSDLEIAGGGEKRLFVFEYPRDVQGTAVLSHTKSVDEKQWIFLPAFKRVKRISSANKSSPFVGSEFSYEDLASIELEKYQYRYLKSENYKGCECDVVEMIPVYDNSGYTKQVAYVDNKEHVIRRVEYYDQSGELLKSLELEEYQLFLGRYWRPLRLHMVNHQNNNKTLMLWRDVKYRNGLKDNDVSVAALKRAR